MTCSLSRDLLNSRKILFHVSDVIRDGTFMGHNVNPVAVEIHPTTMCNHRCIHCSYKERNQNRISLNKDVMDTLIHSIINMKVKAVYFSGGGEPTMYPNITKYIETLYDNGIEVALLTNGSTLEKAGIVDIANMFNYIAVSVPSVTRENFDYITGGGGG